jgi:hypothetical protein
MAKRFEEKKFYYQVNPQLPVSPQHTSEVQLQLIPVFPPLPNNDPQNAFPGCHTIISFFYLPPMITHLENI